MHYIEFAVKRAGKYTFKFMPEMSRLSFLFGGIVVLCGYSESWRLDPLNFEVKLLHVLENYKPQTVLLLSMSKCVKIVERRLSSWCSPAAGRAQEDLCNACPYLLS
jgi:hypothetical protein